MGWCYVRGVRKTTLAGVLLGIGFGGFVDGIVLHQVLQWHHMLTSQGGYPSTTVAGLEVNTLWDGLFHASMWLLTLGGLWLLFDGARRGEVRITAAQFAGLLAAGWGGFNLVEGVVNHHILTLHHVREQGSDALPWDLGFLVFGALLLGGGVWLYRRDARGAEAVRR